MIAYGIYLGSNPHALMAYLKRDIPGVAIMPDAGATTLASVLSLIPVAIFVAAMWQARSLFRLLGKSRIFDPAAPRLLARLGRLAIAAALAGIVMRTLVVLAITSANPPGQQQLFIGIGSDEISSLIVGLLFFAFSLVMQEALRIDEENRSIL